MAQSNGKSNGHPLRQPGMVRVPSPTVKPVLVDQWGRDIFGDAFAPPHDPLEGVDRPDVAGVIYRDLPVLTTTTGTWSIDDIREALAAHMTGFFARSAHLCDDVMADDRVQATLGSRTGGLFSQKLTHKIRNRKNPLSKACRDAWKAAWPKIVPQSVGSETIRWSVSMGFFAAEILWDTTGPFWIPIIKPFHPRNIYFRWNDRKYMALTQDGEIPIEPGNGKWFLYAPHSAVGGYRSWVHGALRAIAQKWFIKGLAFRDWARFGERHGLPVIKATVPAAGDPNQKANFIASMRRLGQEAVVGLPQNVDGTKYDVELMEATDRAWESFPGLIDRCDKSIVLPILWQTLTTELPEGGSYAAARVHGDVRQNAIEFDNATLSEAIHEQIARPFAKFNFDDPDAATFSTWNVTPPEDYNAKSQVLARFAQSMQYFRAAGWTLDDIQRVAKSLGIDLGKVSPVDPVQVEARLAQATGKADDPANVDGEDDEETKALWGQLRVLQSNLAKVEALVRRAA